MENGEKSVENGEKSVENENAVLRCRKKKRGDTVN